MAHRQDQQHFFIKQLQEADAARLADRRAQEAEVDLALFDLFGEFRRVAFAQVEVHAGIGVAIGADDAGDQRMCGGRAGEADHDCAFEALRRACGLG
jgi:hypothetical protein